MTKVSGPAFQALTLAEQEARRRNHPYIGTQHILLGLAGIPQGQAVKALGKLGVGPGMVRAAVEFTLGNGEQPARGEVGLTARAERVMELAEEQAHNASRTSITTLDLLVALLRDGEGVAAGLLESLGVTLGRMAALEDLG